MYSRSPLLKTEEPNLSLMHKMHYSAKLSPPLETHTKEVWLCEHRHSTTLLVLYTVVAIIVLQVL